MKIYVILIALLPLAAIGLDMHLNNSNVSFLRSVASGELEAGNPEAAGPDSVEGQSAEAGNAEAGSIVAEGSESQSLGAGTVETADAVTGAASSAAESNLDQASNAGEQLSVDGTVAPAADAVASTTPPAEAPVPNSSPADVVVTETVDDAASDVAAATESATGSQVAALPDSTSVSNQGTANQPASGEVDTNLVWLVQDRLNRLGYVGSEPLIPDGRLNANTTLAIRAYQIHQGLPSDGQPSTALLEHLESSLEQTLASTSPSFVEQSAAAAQSEGVATNQAPTESAPELGAPLISDAGPTTSDAAVSDTGASASSAVTSQDTQTAALPPAEAPAEAPAEVNDPIADSADSSLVFLIQDRLNRLGYSGNQPLSPDGRLGPRTKALITTYQEDKGLPPTSAPTEALLNHMEATLTGRKPQSSLPTVVDDSASGASDGESAPETNLAVTGLATAPLDETSNQPAASRESGYTSFRKGLAATREGAMTAAIKHYSQAIDSQDWLEKHLAFSRRGDAYSDQGNLDAALADYSAAIRLKPDYTDAMMRRALVYEAKEMTDHAISDYRRVTELDPGEGRAAERLQRLGITTQ